VLYCYWRTIEDTYKFEVAVDEFDSVHTKRSSKFEILSSCTKLFCS